MCTQPIYIKNPKCKTDRSEIYKSILPYDPHIDKRMLAVPCGCCPECNQKRINEHAIRNYYEYLDVTEYQEQLTGKKGHAFFNTLTYNDDNIPSLYGLLTFSTEHRQNFIKRLRNRLRRSGYEITGNRIYKGNVYKTSFFKYYWTCEYGETFSRPHYHVLFYCYFEIDPMTFCKLVDDCWELGYTQFNNPHGKNGEKNKYYKNYALAELDDERAAINYVAKYASKGVDFLRALNNQKGSTFLLQVNKLREKRLLEPLDYISNLNQLRDLDIRIDNCLPSHKFSQRFGIYAIEKLSDDQLLMGRIPMPDKESDIGFRYASIDYVDKKVFYDYNNGVKRHIPNDKFLEMRDIRAQHNIDYVEKHIVDTFETIDKYKNNRQFLDKCNNVILSICDKYNRPLSRSARHLYETYLSQYDQRYSLAVYKVLFDQRENYKLDLLKWSHLYRFTSDHYCKILHCTDKDLIDKINSPYYIYYANFLSDCLDVLNEQIGIEKQRQYYFKKQKEVNNKIALNLFDSNST